MLCKRTWKQLDMTSESLLQEHPGQDHLQVNWSVHFCMVHYTPKVDCSRAFLRHGSMHASVVEEVKHCAASCLCECAFRIMID